MTAAVFPVRSILNAVKAQVVTALPAGTPSFVLVEPVKVLEQRYPLAVTVFPIAPTDYAAAEELAENEVSQAEVWRVRAYLVIGKSNEDEALQDAETYVEDVMQALVGFQPETYCHSIERARGGFFGLTPNGQVWGVDVTFDRWTGETP